MIDEVCLRPVRGMKDYLPDEYYPLLRVCERLAKVAEGFGYLRVETPAVEHFEVLKLKAGEEVVNEIYYFRDKANRELGLRFDMTVPIARIVAYRQDLPKPIRWYYISKVWRYDEPQHGRFREFHQFGVEHIGSSSIRADCEVMTVAVESLRACSVEGFELRLNDREIVERLMDNLSVPNSMRSRVLRVLDKRGKISRDEMIQMLQELSLSRDAAETLVDLAHTTCRMERAVDLLREVKASESLVERLNSLTVELDRYGIIDYVLFDLGIVRGLDYYTSIVFEIFVRGYDLAVGGGGRYDDLIQLYRGIKIPALGFAIGVERLLEVLSAQGKLDRSCCEIDYYIYVVGDQDHLWRVAHKIARSLRTRGLKVVVDTGERSLRSALEYASKIGVRHFVIVGPKEVKDGAVKVRDMRSWTENVVAIDELTRT